MSSLESNVLCVEFVTATALIAFHRTNVVAKWIELEIGKSLKEIKLKCF